MINQSEKKTITMVIRIVVTQTLIKYNKKQGTINSRLKPWGSQAKIKAGPKKQKM